MNILCRATLLLACAIAVTGCASSKTRIDGAWYLVERPEKSADGTTKQHATVRLAFLNIGRQTVTVDAIDIRGNDDASTPGWTWPKSADGATPASAETKLPPGGLLVITLDTDAGSGAENRQCLLPIRAFLQIRESSRPYRLELRGSLPNALPDDWLECRQRAGA